MTRGLVFIRDLRRVVSGLRAHRVKEHSAGWMPSRCSPDASLILVTRNFPSSLTTARPVTYFPILLII